MTEDDRPARELPDWQQPSRGQQGGLLCDKQQNSGGDLRQKHRLPQKRIWFVFLKGRLRCSDTKFAEPSFVLMFAWTLVDNSLVRRIKH